MLTVTILITLFYFINGTNNVETSSDKPLQAVEYCVGCKVAVQAVHRYSTNKIRELEKNNKEKFNELNDADEANQKYILREIVDLKLLEESLCAFSYFSGFAPFVRRSCDLILQNHSKSFLSVYYDAVTEDYSNSKGNLYNKMGDICVNKVKACPPQYFQRSDLLSKERTKCNACKLIADDLELVLNVVKEPNTESLVANICNSIGFDHRPHVWLEEQCEEIMEELDEEILETVQSYMEVRDKSLVASICVDMMKCTYEKKRKLRSPTDLFEESVRAGNMVLEVNMNMSLVRK